MDTITLAEAADQWGLSAARVRLLVTTGRIPGAEKIFVRGLPEWRIPRNSKQPEKITPGPKPSAENELRKPRKKVQKKRIKSR